MSTITVDPLTEFFDAIKNPLTKDRYTKRLDLFLKHIGIEGSTLKERAKKFADKARDTQWATIVINDYMRFQKQRAERGEISESTVPNFYKPIKLFLEMNDVTLNWKKISKRIPKGQQYGQDRAPNIDEIKTILTYPDRRIKPVVLTMESSGIRIGSWDYLKWGHITPIERDGQSVAAKIIVYQGTDDEYFTFITPEAYNAIQEYMKYRESCGERIGPNSPVIRDLFHPDRGGQGEPHLPKQLKSTGVKRMIEDALKGTGIRKTLEKGKRRHEFQADHGFRKFFKSVCERHMKSLHVEILMGHNIGLNANYYRPSENELLNDYLKAVPDLTIYEKPERPLTNELREIREILMQQKEMIEKQGEEIDLLKDVIWGLTHKPSQEDMRQYEDTLKKLLKDRHIG
ncbi:MAG: hypothetical protein H3Z51_13240 [archaeon]|nr:hypothetical protein [archaeon]